MWSFLAEQTEGTPSEEEKPCNCGTREKSAETENDGQVTQDGVCVCAVPDRDQSFDKKA